MATRKTFKVQCKEQGRGRASTESFSTLAEARDFVASHWQGADYIDGEAKFHTDFSTFSCIGFTLADIGKRRWEDGWFAWDWIDLDAKVEEEKSEPPEGNYRPVPVVYADYKTAPTQTEPSEPPPF